MLRTRTVEISVWEAVLPEEVLRSSDELARVDALLDDLAFVPFFDPRLGRPSTPMKTYLRLMFVTFRHRLGYESLCREVADSITWRRFCRIPLDGRVPHPTTLMKRTTRCGTTTVDGLNEALLAKAAEARVLGTARLRADTTVVPADVAHPTDPSLLAKALRAKAGRRIARAGRRIQAAGGATWTRVRDGGRSAGARARAIGAKLRLCTAAGRDEAQAALIWLVRRITGGLASLADTAVREIEPLLVNARRALCRKAQAVRGRRDAAAGRRRARPHRAINDLAALLDTTRRIVRADSPAAGRQHPGRSDPAGQPVRRRCPSDRQGRLGRPIEFGYKAQVIDNDDGIVVDHVVEPGNPTDAPQLAPAIKRVIDQTRRRPRTITADRGYGEATSRPIFTISGCARWSSPARGDPAKSAKPTSGAVHSAELSNGAPAAKPGSAPSNPRSA